MKTAKQLKQQAASQNSALSTRRLFWAGALGLGALLYFSYQKAKKDQRPQFHHLHGHDRIDEASIESFPASDSPATY